MEKYNNLKLTIELVPSSSWYSNVRTNVSQSEWDVIRKKSYRSANYKCEICGDSGINQGYRHPVECHEVWEYDDKRKIQKLKSLISLCPNCHKVKHAGLSCIVNGEKDIVINQLVKVNGMSLKQAKQYLKFSFDVYYKRSKYDWKLDISYLNSFV